MRKTAAQRTKEWREKFPERARETRKRLYYANHEREKASRRNSECKRKYGITIVERDAMLIAQGYCCAACGDRLEGIGRGSHTDHCHRTATVRAILCSGCNQALGNVKESIPRLRSLITYLETHSVAT